MPARAPAPKVTIVVSSSQELAESTWPTFARAMAEEPAGAVPVRTPDAAPHVPVEPLTIPGPVNSAVVSSVMAGGTICTEMLSNLPRAPFEPTPTKPLLSPTVTVVPLTATSIEYHLSDLTPPCTEACTSTCQPDEVRRPITSLFVDWSTPANLKSVGEK